MKRIVIGLVGPMVSGKGDVAAHLKSLGFHYDSLSDRCREEADARGIPRTRKNLQDVGNDLRETFGLQVLAERTVEILREVDGYIVIDGVRNPGEIAYLRNELDAMIIGIDAPVELRLKWYLERAAKRGEDFASEDEFHKNNNRDFGIGEPEGGQQVGKCLAMSDFVLVNDGTKEQLFETMEHLLIKEYAFTPEGARKNKEK